MRSRRGGRDDDVLALRRSSVIGDDDAANFCRPVASFNGLALDCCKPVTEEPGLACEV